jgi:hypothetical protein
LDAKVLFGEILGNLRVQVLGELQFAKKAVVGIAFYIMGGRQKCGPFNRASSRQMLDPA